METIISVITCHEYEEIRQEAEKRQTPKKTSYYDKKKNILVKPGTHTYHKWTEEEDAYLLNPPAGPDGTTAALAYKFGVTCGAIYNRRNKLLNRK